MQTGDAAADAWARAERLAGLGHWHWHLPSGQVTWSAGLHRLLPGAAPAEPPFGNWARHWTAASRTALQAAVDHSRRTGEGHALLLEARRHGGRASWLQARAEALRDAAGAVVALHGTLQDVTAERSLEELRTQRAIAEAAAEGRARFVGRLDAALRSPLNVVLGIAEALRRQPGAVAPGPVDGLAAAGAQMRNALDQLGELADAGLGRTKLQRVAVDLAPLLARSIADARAAASPDGPRLEDAVFEGEAGLVVGDPTAVARVLEDLFEAALHGAPAGGRVTVRVRRVMDRVELRIATASRAGAGPDASALALEGARAWLALMNGELVERNPPGGGCVWSARFAAGG